MFIRLCNVACPTEMNKTVEIRKVHTNCTQILIFNENEKDGKC